MPTHTPSPPADAPAWKLQRWSEYKEITSFNEQPYPMTAAEHEGCLFPYWFNYSWTELKNHRIEDWLPFYRRVFEPDGTVKQEFAELASGDKKAFLEELLAQGFEVFPARLRKDAAALLEGSSLTDAHGAVLGIAFRGDSRTPELMAFIESVRELQNDVGMMLMLQSRPALDSYRAALAQYFQERLQVYQPAAGAAPPRITRYGGILGEPARRNFAAAALLPHLTWPGGQATWQGV